MDENIDMVGAVYDENVLAKYYLSCKAMVIPSAAGLSIQHTFAYGVPVVVGDDMPHHGPEIELVVHGNTGLLCHDGDVNDFAHAICRLLSNDHECRQMSKNALKVIYEKYNVDNMAKGIADTVRYAAE